MTNIHGIHIDVEQVGNQIFMEIKAIGTLTHSDYEKIIPLIEDAMEGIEHPVINVYIDGTEFEGWQLQAAWDDLKLGLKHGRKFHKVAIYGNQRWQEIMSKVGGWFISGEVRYFDDSIEAINWLRV
ncbi:hypothetical protein JCM19237_6100 [Photobacterium aphoticum]|uniref:STAS/SEC14 domain-containing protein n=1 Tax=Photobacterium aphoticum TaxID=754436 RepID=A0A090R6D1_9GAMM|nr:hypothetical protein JCM19237_6100 [Photobacterium aphoticum]